MPRLLCGRYLIVLCLLAVACGPILSSPGATEVPASGSQEPATPTPRAQKPQGGVDLGALVHPSASAPILTVDEYPIVTADVDAPGSIEYLDRLGSDILSRLEGLRDHAVEGRLASANAALAPFGCRLQERFDPQWERTFYDLYKEGAAEPLALGLSDFWPVSVNASGTDFILAAENAPNTTPMYLLVSAAGVRAWDDADQSAWMPPVYAGDSLARLTFRDYPTITYEVQLDGETVYTGTAEGYGAYMPLRSLNSWEGHWLLEVDDHLIVDGQDLGQLMGYDAVFGFSVVQGLPFYFFEQDGDVRISYAGRTLPFIYEEVVHNQCCEAAAFNVQAYDNIVLFHALWDGTWYFVEAGVYDGEMASTYRYTAPEGWSLRYPAHWDLLDPELGFVGETATGKMVTFASAQTSQEELESWLESEIARKLEASEAENTLAERHSVQEGELAVYSYAILSRTGGSETLLRTTVLFDGQRRYEFSAAIPPVAEEEYEAILASFSSAS